MFITFFHPVLPLLGQRVFQILGANPIRPAPPDRSLLQIKTGRLIRSNIR